MPARSQTKRKETNEKPNSSIGRKIPPPRSQLCGRNFQLGTRTPPLERNRRGGIKSPMAVQSIRR